jgi:hypothetical protein
MLTGTRFGFAFESIEAMLAASCVPESTKSKQKEKDLESVKLLTGTSDSK